MFFALTLGVFWKFLCFTVQGLSLWSNCEHPGVPDYEGHRNRPQVSDGFWRSRKVRAIAHMASLFTSPTVSPLHQFVPLMLLFMMEVNTSFLFKVPSIKSNFPLMAKPTWKKWSCCSWSSASTHCPPLWEGLMRRSRWFHLEASSQLLLTSETSWRNWCFQLLITCWSSTFLMWADVKTLILPMFAYVCVLTMVFSPPTGSFHPSWVSGTLCWSSNRCSCSLHFHWGYEWEGSLLLSDLQ